MITLTKVTKTFGPITAVKEVSLHIEKQEIFGIVGPDGAGKTTLLRMICGLIDPDTGNVQLLGKPINKLEEMRNLFGYMPQKFSLYGDLTVMENINFFGSLYGLDYKTIKNRAEEILSVTRLLPFHNRMADKLSGGMKQKLALCIALITRPSLLILDEPTFGVDPESRREFWKILYTLNNEGMTILVTTPYMDEAELCTKVGFLNAGVLKTVDSPLKLKQEFPYKVIEVHTTVRDISIFDNITGIIDIAFFGYKYRLITDTSINVMEKLQKNPPSNITLIEEVDPTMEDLFIMAAEQE
ncbi:MAG: ABC transporter ATP-binding protein [Syntrophomonadaceae bacterium]|nr:ABC transporter ATP-binding protein [Syntrophomonadaceae bacterium]